MAALCLVILGVHTAGDRLDNLTFAAVDRLDLMADSAVWAITEALSGAGALSTQTAARWAGTFAEWVDLEEKESLSLWLALITEIGCILSLLDYAWGPRTPPKGATRSGHWAGLRHSTKDTLSRLKQPHIALLVVPPALFILSLVGIGTTALAMETGAAHLLARLDVGSGIASALAALMGIAAGLILLGRVVPDLIEGALLRSFERGDETRPRKGKRLTLLHLRLGWPRAALVALIAGLAIAAHGPLSGLLSRAGGLF